MKLGLCLMAVLVLGTGLALAERMEEKQRLAVIAFDIEQTIIELKKLAKTQTPNSRVRVRYYDNRSGSGIIDDLRRIQEGIRYAINEQIELDNRPPPLSTVYSEKR